MLKEDFEIIFNSEDILKYMRIFDRKILTRFNSITFSYINFNLDDNQKNIHKSRIYYSKKYKTWISLYNTLNDIKYAIGKYDSDVKIENNEKLPLIPKIIFNFNLNNESKNYNSFFAIKNEEVHIISKIHNLNEKEIVSLSNNNILIKNNEEYFIDWGHIKKFKSFVNNVKKISRTIDLETSKTNLIAPNEENKTKNSKTNTVVYTYCMKCGTLLNYTNIRKFPKEFNKKYPAKCEECLEKIYALTIYDKLTRENNGLININVLRNELEDEDLFKFTTNILNKLEFTKHLNNNTYLKLNESIESEYSNYINPPIKFTNLKLLNEEEVNSQTELIIHSKYNKLNKTKRKQKKTKLKQLKLSKKSNGRYSLYDEIDFDINKNKWVAHFNNKFLGYFNDEETARKYRFNYLRSIPIPPLQSNGKYSLHKGIGFDKLNKLWTVNYKNKFLGKFNSEKEAYEYLENYKKSNNSSEYVVDSNKRTINNINSKNIKNLIILNSEEESINLLLKGNINQIRTKNLSAIIQEEELNELICNKTEKGFEIIIDLNIKSNVKEKIEHLTRLGWKNLKKKSN